MSILPHDLRLSSITQAAGFFDHRDRLTHDNELREGAANILYQKLAFGLSLSSTSYEEQGDTINRLRHRDDSADHEVALLCSCLEMVHRASPDAIAATWYDVGEDILPILVRVIERPFLRLSSSGKTSRDLKLAVQKVTKLLAMYSLVPEAKYPMVVCPGLLTVLVKVIDTRNLNRVRSHGPSTGLNGVRGASTGVGLIMTEAARFNTIATLTNLAAAEENRITMLTTPGLVDNVARIVQNERSEVARQCSALALMNLSNGDKNHVPEMASELLLETLVTLINDDLPETRRNAAVALFNVACADENTLRVARYKDGVILGALLEIIKNDDADDSRAEAAETLFNMSCSDAEETTDRMSNHPGLLENLAEVLHSPRASIDVKLYCAATLRRMAEIIRTPMMSQGPLLSALVKAASWTRTSDISEAFDAHADPAENRLAMAEHHGLLNGLAGLAQLSTGGAEADQIRDAALRCIEKLARDEVAQRLLANNVGIMTALTQANSVQTGDDRSPVHAALKNLIAAN
mmetsp:Transcript_28385/g.41945  ORF Transcript_28385/g.41945 Transcript_28385/m.41945 type:complete len:521 (+) Transcript_28385:276-1838(+)